MPLLPWALCARPPVPVLLCGGCYPGLSVRGRRCLCCCVGVVTLGWALCARSPVPVLLCGGCYPGLSVRGCRCLCCCVGVVTLGSLCEAAGACAAVWGLLPWALCARPPVPVLPCLGSVCARSPVPVLPCGGCYPGLSARQPVPVLLTLGSLCEAAGACAAVWGLLPCARPPGLCCCVGVVTLGSLCEAAGACAAVWGLLPWALCARLPVPVLPCGGCYPGLSVRGRRCLCCCVGVVTLGSLCEAAGACAAVWGLLPWALCARLPVPVLPCGGCYPGLSVRGCWCLCCCVGVAALVSERPVVGPQLERRRFQISIPLLESQAFFSRTDTQQEAKWAELERGMR